jgi:hypothetical protein
MSNPVKLIWKYKNKNRRIQYHIYLFIGSVEKNVKEVLDKIRDLSLYDSLLALNQKEIKIISNKYGEDWFYQFYNKYHINETIRTILRNKEQRKKIISKYGEKWVAEYIDKYNIEKFKPLISYYTSVKNLYERSKKRRKTEKDEEIEIDYRIGSRGEKNINDIFQLGGEVEETGEEEGEEVNLEEVENIELKEGENEEEIPEMNEEEEVNIEELEKLYQGEDKNIDKEHKKTYEMINKAFEGKYEKKKDSLKTIDFDESKMESPYDQKLKDVYQKKYVETLFIYHDDTIKKIKEKICTIVRNSSEYGEVNWIPPTRQYLWSEYPYKNNLEKFMIGHKWMRRTEPLRVDVEPIESFRYYEELRDNLNLFSINLLRHGRRISMENELYKLYSDFEEYIQNNEIYMVDIYNELGNDYSPAGEVIENLMQVYMKLYFPFIGKEEFNNILEYLKGKEGEEKKIIDTVYHTIRNDMIIEKESMDFLEKQKKIKDEKYFNNMNVFQAIMHVRLSTITDELNMYKLFDSFITNDNYPHLQYRTNDNTTYFKFSTKEIEKQILSGKTEIIKNWLETRPSKIVFRVKIEHNNEEKFMTVNMDDQGKIEYKVQWKDHEKASIEDIKNTYENIKNLVKKINKDIGNKYFEIPKNNQFEYGFISTMQKFELPINFVIDHNDFSDFARFFFPYASVVIDPRKRIAKGNIEEKGKAGTELRYRRTSNYDNPEKIHQRIIYFIKNYETTDTKLAEEISRQFNITEEKSMEYINYVREKYPKLKKARKVLKKFENLPKYSHPGIYIYFHGKSRENYKIRINGAKNPQQLKNIHEFCEALLYTYIQTYIYNKKEYNFIKQRLKSLSNVAKRRNLIETAVSESYTTDLSKRGIAKLDKKRLGFKPEKGQNHWRRLCQNSGNDKRRQPLVFTQNEIDKLHKKGYKYNSKKDIYEKKVKIKENGKEKNVYLRTVEFPDYDEEGNSTGEKIQYACTPEDNGDHMYIGFLTKSSNPFGLCMPCCFKKDPQQSRDPNKRELFYRCLEQGTSYIKNKIEGKNEVVGDRLYILQDTNKLQEGRFSYLPKLLDKFLNQSMRNELEVKQHYMLKTVPNYYLKYGIVHQRNSFLSAISSVFNISIEKLFEKIEKKFKEENSDALFISLREGKIKQEFETIENYLKYLKNNEDIPYYQTIELLGSPGILSTNGINILVFERLVSRIKKELERDELVEDFSISCSFIDPLEGICRSKKPVIFLLKDDELFNPIVNVKKDNPNTKVINIEKEFYYKNEEKNIVNHISDYYYQNCNKAVFRSLNLGENNYSAAKVYQILCNSNEYSPKAQYIDSHYKCRYLILKNNLIFPVLPSGALYFLKIEDNLDKYKKNLNTTMKDLKNFIKDYGSFLNTKIKGIFFLPQNKKNKNKKVEISGVELFGQGDVPVSDYQEMKDIKKYGYEIKQKPIDDQINELIQNQSKKPDIRVKTVKNDLYFRESYQRFRLELYNYLNKNVKTKENLKSIIYDKKLSNDEKRFRIKQMLYKIISNKLYQIFKNLLNDKKQQSQKGGFILPVNKKPELDNYEPESIRKICSEHHNPYHCILKNNKSQLALTNEMIVVFINRVSEELLKMDIPGYELLGLNGMQVSEIMNCNVFTERTDQKIINSSRADINMVMEELFSTEKHTGSTSSYFTKIDEQPSYSTTDKYIIQPVYMNDMPLFRAFTNGYNWIKDVDTDILKRNLGYYSEKQTLISNYLRSLVVDYVFTKPEEAKKIIKEYSLISNKRDFLRNYVLEVMEIGGKKSNGISELIFLSKILTNITIIVFNEDNEFIFIFNDGVKYDSNKHNFSKDLEKKYLNKNSIILRLTTQSEYYFPVNIDVVYLR